MKKLFSIMLVLSFTFVLAGCTSTEVTDLQKQLEEVQAQLDTKTTELTTLTTDKATLVTEKIVLQGSITELEDEILNLELEVTELQDLIFDNIVTFTFDDGYGDYNSETVGFNNNYDGNLFDLLDISFDVNYIETDYGKMIMGVDDIQSMTGSYVAFIKNGEPSMTGVEGSTFDDGDVFGFEIIFWDANAGNVDAAIQLFLQNQVTSFVSETVLDYNVAIALEMLGVLEDYVSDAEMLDQIDLASMTEWNEYLKAAYLLNTIGVDNSNAITLLNDELSNVPTFGYSSTLNAMIAFGQTESNFSTFETTVLDFYNITTPHLLGVDSGGMALVTLSAYDTPEIDALISDYTTWIDTDQLASGGFQTRDSLWGETTFPGTENGSSMAQIILALVSNGIDPNGATYTQGGNTLISRLIEYQTVSGSFDYILEVDPSEDLMFTTPQAFLALVTYQEFLNSGNTAVNPYIQ